ncbi:MFS transporter [Sporomusa sp.]|uniref:MFS transporter n=1 Tax=Sporomusa sp. TaxID=2078658 RepID=UPI002C6FA853|nr:MFS transporter [Sporomusa sp.]HWR44520.1 MFS transporter [Sporomusa sp.]
MNWRKNLWSLWLGCLLSSSSYTMLMPFLPLYLYDLGVNGEKINLWSGLILSATFFVSAMMAPYWGKRADRAGKRKMLLRAGFSLGSVYILGAFVSSPLELLGVRILQGFAAGFVPAALAIVSSSMPEEKVGWGLGIMQAATLTGTIIGPLLGGILSHIFGIRSSFIVAGCVMLLGTCAVRMLVTEPLAASSQQTGSVANDLKLALNNRPFIWILVLLVLSQMVVMLLQPTIPLYVAELQGRIEGVGLTSGIVFSLAGIAGVIGAPLWGRLGHKVGFAMILITVCTGAGLAVSLFSFTESILSFGVLQFVFGFFIAGVIPTVNTITVLNSEPCFRGRAFGVIMSANQLGSMIGPLMGGIISNWIGIKTTFLYTGIFLIIVGVAIWYKCSRKGDKSLSRGLLLTDKSFSTNIKT